MARLVKQKHGWTLKILQKGETANPKGRPKKLISSINNSLLKQWYKQASRSDIEACYLQLIQVPEKRIKLMLKDDNQPVLIKIVIKNMLSGKWFEIIERMLERSIWKPKQEIEQDKNINIKVINYWTKQIKSLDSTNLIA